MKTSLDLSSVPPAWDFHMNPILIGIIIGLVIILLLLISSALISGSKVAFFSLNPKDKAILKKNKRRVNQVVIKNLKHPENLLATILVANNFVNIGIIMLSAYVNSNLFEFSNTPVIEFIVKVVIITSFLVLFGEVIPKVYAVNYSVDFYKIVGCEDTVFDDAKGEVDTLAGLILELKGEIPELHENIARKNFLFSIEGVNNRNIEQINVEVK